LYFKDNLLPHFCQALFKPAEDLPKEEATTLSRLKLNFKVYSPFSLAGEKGDGNQSLRIDKVLAHT